MREFKVGDKVVIREDLNTDAIGIYAITPNMKENLGKVTTVIGKAATGAYFLEIDDGMWLWPEEILEDWELDKYFKTGNIIYTANNNGDISAYLIYLDVLIYTNDVVPGDYLIDIDSGKYAELEDVNFKEMTLYGNDIKEIVRTEYLGDIFKMSEVRGDIITLWKREKPKPEKITKEEIEAILGYEIDIVD